MTDEYKTGDKRVFCGLMPQSISHEGYSAKPMHSYWDDFFALRGYKDAAVIATTFGTSLKRSSIADGARSVPAGHLTHRFDWRWSSTRSTTSPARWSSATSMRRRRRSASRPVDELRNLPQPALQPNVREVLRELRQSPCDSARLGTRTRRTSGAPSARSCGLARKQRRTRSLDFFFEEQRPAAWRQWAEVVCRDSLKPRFIGDMPHTWVGSDYIRSVLDMFAYEREADRRSLIGAGIPEKWVARRRRA